MNKSNESLRNPISTRADIMKYTVLIFFGLNMICLLQLFGQADKKNSVAEKISPRMSLTSTQINSDSILLEASVKVKRDGSWKLVDFEPVFFSVHNDSLTHPLGKALTGDNGVASIKVGVSQLITGEDGFWNFGSVFGGNDTVTEGEAELSITKVGSVISGEKQDTTYSLTLKLFIPGTDNLPIPDAEVGFYVKRHFSNLKIGEGTTDENGEVTIECPRDIPGGSQGNIVLIGRADDLETYGSVTAYIVKPWGVPIPDSEQQGSRSLSSNAPPLWMVIVFAILMSTVWGHYIIIVYKLVKIRNLKTQKS